MLTRVMHARTTPYMTSHKGEVYNCIEQKRFYNIISVSGIMTHIIIIITLILRKSTIHEVFALTGVR